MSKSQRSSTLGRRLDFDVLLLGRPGFRRPWTAPFTYPVLLFRTARGILSRRPPSILVVAPPITAPLIVVPIARLIRAKVGLDIHSGAFLDRRWRWSIPLLRLLAGHASVNVITLQSLACRLGRASKRTLVLPDPLPQFPSDPAAHSMTEPNRDAVVVAIAGWGLDEPLIELCQAAVGQPWKLLITGKPRWSMDLPPNVSLTGFLSDGDYLATLRRADVIVALTTRPETLLSGSWEAVALHRALVVSDTPSLRETFSDTVIYTDPTASGIREALNEGLARRAELQDRITTFAAHFEERSDTGIRDLLQALSPSPG